MRLALLARHYTPTGRPPLVCKGGAHTRRRAFRFLGDYVGYGADPEWTVEAVMGFVAQGALAVRGNHDNAIGLSAETMNAEAQAAIEWTFGG